MRCISAQAGTAMVKGVYGMARFVASAAQVLVFGLGQRGRAACNGKKKIEKRRCKRNRSKKLKQKVGELVLDPTS